MEVTPAATKANQEKAARVKSEKRRAFLEHGLPIVAAAFGGAGGHQLLSEGKSTAYDPGFEKLKRIFLKLPDGSAVPHIYGIAQGILVQRQKQLNIAGEEAPRLAEPVRELLEYVLGAIQFNEKQLNNGVLKALETHLPTMEAKNDKATK